MQDALSEGELHVPPEENSINFISSEHCIEFRFQGGNRKQREQFFRQSRSWCQTWYTKGARQQYRVFTLGLMVTAVGARAFVAICAG